MPNNKYFALHVVDHCNLNCNCCSHFAPYRSKKFHSAEDYIPSIDKLSQENLIETLALTGGEPFLHPNLLQFVRTIRNRYNNLKIILFTNTFWMKSIESVNEYLDVFHNIDVLQVAMYSEIMKDLEKYKCLLAEVKKYVMVNSFNRGIIKKFYEVKFLENKGNPGFCPYVNCCQILADGRLMRCFYGYSLFSNYDTNGFSQTEEMFFDLNKRDVKEVLSWRSKYPFDACYYCACCKHKIDWVRRGKVL